MVLFSTTGLLLHVALFRLGTTHDCAIGQAGPSIWSRLPPAIPSRGAPCGGSGSRSCSLLASCFNLPSWRPKREVRSGVQRLLRRRSPDRGLANTREAGNGPHKPTTIHRRCSCHGRDRDVERTVGSCSEGSADPPFHRGGGSEDPRSCLDDRLHHTQPRLSRV